MKKTKELLVVLMIVFSVVCFSKVSIFSNNVLAETNGATSAGAVVNSGVGYASYEYGYYNSEISTPRDFGRIRNLLGATQNVGTYFYSQLTNDFSRAVYNSLANSLPTDESASLDVSGFGFEYEVTPEQYENYRETARELFNEHIAPYMYDAQEAFDSDHPEIYWFFFPKIEYQYNLLANNKIAFTSVNIKTEIQDQKADYQTFNSKVDTVVASINGESTYDKLKQIHDYMCSTITYANDAGTSKKEHTAYSALVEETAVCDGQAKLFKILCDRKNIPCIFVSGNAITSMSDQIGHAWNYVYIEEDEKWYAVDATWDNNKIYNSPTDYTYFLVGSDTQVTETKTFSQNHLQGVKHYTDQTFIPTVPTLSTTEYEAFSGEYSLDPETGDTSSVTVTVSANRELKPITGWTLSPNKKTMTKVYTQNTSEDFYVYNTRNEKLRLRFTISNIVAGEEFTPTVQYSTTATTASGVTASIVSNKELKTLTGWTLSSDNKTLSKVFFENTTQDVTVTATDNSTETVHISIDNIIAQTCGVSYNPYGITNQNVTATIQANFEMKPLTGWTLSQDHKKLTKEFAQNVSETVTVTNIDGRQSDVTVYISGIDKVAPVVNVEYSTTQETSGSVTATITSNEILKPVDGWTLSNDGLSLTKQYNQNANETVTVSDLAGNTVNKNISISNILSGDFSCSVTYDITDPTNGSVTATITGNRNLAERNDGWTLSGRTLTKEYTANTNETLTITSASGDECSVTVSITNIDKRNPVLSIEYSETEQTLNNVVATITSNEPILEAPNGWMFVQNSRYSIMREYTSNTTETIIVKDLAGNSSAINVEISNILPRPVLSVEYSYNDKTNNDVVVTITSTMEMEPLEGWTLSNNKKTLSKVFSDNYSGTVTVLSALGHRKTLEIEINNIDKVEPNLEVSYSDVDAEGNVTVTITSNEELQEKTGWTLSQDKRTLTRKFSANVEDEVIVTDLAGNTKTISIRVDKINSNHNNGEATQVDSDPNEGAIPSNSGKIVNTDDSTAKGKLSDTGAFHGILITAIAVFGVSGIVGYRKYRKLYK